MKPINTIVSALFIVVSAAVYAGPISRENGPHSGIQPRMAHPASATVTSAVGHNSTRPRLYQFPAAYIQNLKNHNLPGSYGSSDIEYDRSVRRIFAPAPAGGFEGPASSGA